MFLTTAVHTEGDSNGLEYLHNEAKNGNHDFIFVNLVDLDMLYGHREDPHGYYEGLKLIDRKIQGILDVMSENDLIILQVIMVQIQQMVKQTIQENMCRWLLIKKMVKQNILVILKVSIM